MKTFIGIFLLVVLFGTVNTQNVHLQKEQNYRNNAPYLVILSMDGFRWDYSKFDYTPNLDSLARVGVKAKSMMPCFPSKTFPNHYSLLTVLKKQNHLQVYTKQTMPQKFHYNQSDRIFDLVCVADSSWSIYWKTKDHSDGGTHGYDPDNTDMQAIFYASGPAFKKNYVQPTFQNVDLYDLFAHILGLKRVITEGNFEEVKGMLKDNH